jgi:hypothetical protein
MVLLGAATFRKGKVADGHVVLDMLGVTEAFPKRQLVN